MASVSAMALPNNLVKPRGTAWVRSRVTRSPLPSCRLRTSNSALLLASENLDRAISFSTSGQLSSSYAGTCATTSRTVQPEHSEGNSHSVAERSAT